MNTYYNRGLKLNALGVILALNTVLFILALLFQGLTGEFERFDQEFLSMMGVLSTYLIERGQFWLILTFNFVHFDPIHFLFNIYALYSLGTIIDYFYGSRKLFVTYILGGISAGVFSYMYSSILNENIVTLGASGAIFALLGLLVAGAMGNNRFGADLPVDIKSLYPTMLVAVFISFLPNINFMAHFGGFFVGFLLGKFVIRPELHNYHNIRNNLFTLLYQFSILVSLISALLFVGNFINIIFLAD